MAGTLGTISGQVRLDVRQAVASYAALRAQNQRTVYAMRGTGDSFVQAGQNMAIAGAAMVYGFSRVVNAAAEFERKMDYASAVSGTTGKKMQELSDFALELGKNTIYSAGEIADGFIELAKSGLSAEQIIGGIGTAMANLGAAGDIPLAQSGQIITSTIQQFDMSARDAVKVTDLLAGAANASIADISDIGVSLKYVGGVANAAGLDFEDTATAISLLAKAGIRGSTAGTSLRQMIVSLGGATEPARDALKELGILSGDELSNKFFDAEGNAKSLSEVFQILQDSTADLTNKQRLMYLRTIFNNRALSAASILTRDGAKGFREMNREMSKVTAAEVASERLDNLSGDIEILRGNIETLMVEQGGPFQETLRGWVQGITDLVQAFSELEPSTQKNITQFVAVAGVALLVMGAINIVIGTIFRFLASMSKMGAGLRFLGGIIKIVWTNLKFFWALIGKDLVLAIGRAAATIGGLVLRFGRVITVVGAVLTALTLLYQKWAPFRNMVNTFASAVWNGIKAVGRFFKLLATDPGEAWEMLKNGFSSFVDWVQSLPGRIQSGLSSAGDRVKAFADSVVDFFASLPGRIGGIVSGLISTVTELFTFKNIGYALGFVVGTVIRIFAQLLVKLVSLVGRIVSGVGSAFARLAPRVGYLIGFMAGKVIGFFLRMGIRVLGLIAKMIAGVISFVAKLPGRVIGFITRMVVSTVAKMIQFARDLPENAAKAATGIVQWIRDLPERVGTLISNMVSRARNLLTRMKENFINTSYELYNGLMSGIEGLPGAVSGLFDRIVGAVKEQISSAYASVKDFSAGMWQGFKDGLGIKSPSYIEEAIWQITGVLDKETKAIAKKTMEVQRLSKKMAASQFGVADMGMTSGARDYIKLASMHANNLKRARSLSDASGTLSITHARRNDQRSAMRKARSEFEITNWQTGRGFMRGVAQEAIDDDHEYDDILGRMG